MGEWRVAKALEQLRAEINKAAPKRSTASDGSIGDTAHSSRTSDHNPNSRGVVRARDFTHDPDHGVDGNKLAERIRDLGRAGHPALGPGSYVIWNRRIASATQDGAPWDWEPYTGSNPHTKHVHVSVSTAARGYDSTRKWGVMAAAKKAAKKAPAKRPANHVEKGHEYGRKMLEEFRAADKSRTVVHIQAERLARILDDTPES